MRKIGITGSLSSGKTTASKILSFKKGPLFSADEAVKKLYKSNSFKKVLYQKFKIQNSQKIKSELKKKILADEFFLNKLERIIHPLVRKKMNNFISIHKKKKYLFFEIPLLIESKLMKIFDIIIFIKSKKSTRLKRFKIKGGNEKLFKILNKKQLSDKKKIKYCNHVVVNEKKINILKKKLLDIMTKYE